VNAGLNSIRIGTQVLHRLLFIRIVKHGKEHIHPERKPYIVVYNHQSFLDIPAASCSVPFGVRYLGKVELMKIPVFGYILKKMTVIVDRRNKHDRSKSLDSLRRSLAEGVSVMIAPEGTRNKTASPVQPFYDGAFRLALETKVPILVITIKGRGNLLRGTQHMELRPGRIDTWVDEPVQVMPGDTLDTLKERTRQCMLRHL